MTDGQLSHCKLCELSDFAAPELRELIRDVYASDLEHFGDQDFPTGREYRKYWEVAMTLRAFRSLGVLRDDARVLGVGAGREATIYWLTRHVGEVVATDLYRTEDNWSESDSSADMLTDPGRYWDEEWNPERLTVRHMDAMQLEFDDDSFDAIFSSSSIEHFGDFPDVRRSVEEMFRVLRPGGRPRPGDGVPARGRPRSATRACCASTSPSSAPCSSTASGGTRPRRWSSSCRTRPASPRWR